MDEFILTDEQVVEAYRRAHGFERKKRILQDEVEDLRRQILRKQHELDSTSKLIEFLRSLGGNKHD